MIKKKLLTSAAAVTLCALISAHANSNTNKVTEPSYNPVTYTEILNDAKSTNDVLTIWWACSISTLYASEI